MKLLFMLCNNCMRLCTQSQYWLVDHKNCACIFIEEAEPKMPIFMVQHEAAKQEREMYELAKNTMSIEQFSRYCFENGYAVPEPKEPKQ